MASDQELAKLCKVLSVDTRVRIINLLKRRSLCVGALSKRLDVTQGAVSQHLRILREANLVEQERSGCFIHYRLNAATVGKWRKMIGRFLTVRADPPARH